FELSRLESTEDGNFQYPVALEEGPNLFTLTASNAGGTTTTHLTLTYTPPPVQVRIQGIEPRPGASSLVKLRARAEGLPIGLDPLPEAEVALQGWVERARSYQFRADPRVQVWVNGFPQVEVPLGPADRENPLRRPFRAPILLGRDENTVDIRLSGV